VYMLSVYSRSYTAVVTSGVSRGELRLLKLGASDGAARTVLAHFASQKGVFNCNRLENQRTGVMPSLARRLHMIPCNSVSLSSS